MSFDAFRYRVIPSNLRDNLACAIVNVLMSRSCQTARLLRSSSCGAALTRALGLPSYHLAANSMGLLYVLAGSPLPDTLHGALLGHLLGQSLGHLVRYPLRALPSQDQHVTATLTSSARL